MKNAEFLAAVEYLGYTSWYVAKLLNVKELDVRYQMAGDWPVSPEAERLANDLVAGLHADIAKAMEAFEYVDDPSSVLAILPYYRGQREYLEVNGGEGYFKYGNTLSREIAQECQALGAAVSYAYPDEPGFTTALRLVKR